MAVMHILSNAGGCTLKLTLCHIKILWDEKVHGCDEQDMWAENLTVWHLLSDAWAPKALSQRASLVCTALSVLLDAF